MRNLGRGTLKEPSVEIFDQKLLKNVIEFDLDRIAVEKSSLDGEIVSTTPPRPCCSLLLVLDRLHYSCTSVAVRNSQVLLCSRKHIDSVLRDTFASYKLILVMYIILELYRTTRQHHTALRLHYCRTTQRYGAVRLRYGLRDRRMRGVMPKTCRIESSRLHY